MLGIGVLDAVTEGTGDCVEDEIGGPEIWPDLRQLGNLLLNRLAKGTNHQDFCSWLQVGGPFQGGIGTVEAFQVLEADMCGLTGKNAVQF